MFVKNRQFPQNITELRAYVAFTLILLVRRCLSVDVLPKVIWEEPRCKVPITMGHPKFNPKTTDNHPDIIHHPSTDPTHHPKRHLDPISRFATIHFPDRPTHAHTRRPTDGLGDRSVRWAAYALLIASDAAKKYCKNTAIYFVSSIANNRPIAIAFHKILLARRSLSA